MVLGEMWLKWALQGWGSWMRGWQRVRLGISSEFWIKDHGWPCCIPRKVISNVGRLNRGCSSECIVCHWAGQERQPLISSCRVTLRVAATWKFASDQYLASADGLPMSTEWFPRLSVFEYVGICTTKHHPCFTGRIAEVSNLLETSRMKEIWYLVLVFVHVG